MSSLDYLDLCRLCLVKDQVSVPIFDGEGDVRQIFLKIAACLPVKLTRDDKLPKKICNDCVYKVELFYEFWNTTSNSEKQLMQWLGEVDVNDKQTYVTAVINQDQSSDNRLDGNVMQQTNEHQNNMGMNIIETMSLEMPMMMSTDQTQMTINTTNNSNSQSIQALPGTSAQQKDGMGESEEDNSDDDMDRDEGLPVKEEIIQDTNRIIEPGAFLNVSLPCDEPGPSGLQQQKNADIPDMVIGGQTTESDNKAGTSPLTEQDIKVEFETWQPTVCDNLRTELQKTQSTNIGSNALKEVPRIQSTNINRNTRQKELWDKAMSVDVEELLDCSFCGEVFHNKFGLIDHEAICQPLLSNRAPQNDSDQRHRKTTRSSRSKEQQIDEIIAHETELMAICSDELKKEPQDHQPLLPIKQENKTEEMQLQESIDIDVDMMKKELGEDVILLDAEEAFNCSYCGSIFYSESSLITHETDMHPPLETNDQYQSSTSSVDVQEINNFAENSDDSVEIVHVHKSLPANSSVQLVANRSNIHHQININSSHSKKLIEEAIDKYTNDKLKSLQTAQQAEGNSNQGEVNSSTSAELVKPLLTFTCIICSEKFSSKSLILNHVKEKHYENIFKCDQCNFETLHESQMQEHSKIHPKILEEQDEIQEILITNPKIDAKSGGDKTKENLETGSKVDGNSGENETPVNSKTDTNIDGKLRENEIEENSKSQSKIYLKPECDICKRTYSHMSTFKKHYRTFHQNPVPKYVCDFESCRYVTHVQGRLAEHKTRQHSKVKEDLLHCKIAGCVATFRYQSHLKIHILHRHSDTLECYFECDTCHKRFDEKFKLIKHLETHNKKNVKVYKCKACSITFNSNYYYEKHFFSVHKKAKFSCKYCGDKFMNRNKLWSHENNKHLKPAINETFECFKCNKKFKSRKTLEKHLKPRSNEVFECPECQKKFRSKMSMERHRKNHSESHFDCADCGYQTKHKELLKRHIVRKHTKKYNFKCTEPGCDKKFKLNIDYQWHVKKCHDKSVTG